MEQSQTKSLTGADTAWLRMDSPTNLMVINAMIITDEMDFEAFRKVIAARFLKFPRFKSKPEHHNGHYVWREDELFELDCHVRRTALPGEADKQALQAYVADMASTALDESKPLWQIHFIDNYVGGNAILLRVHHSYADGLALIAVFNSITDADPQGAASTEAAPDLSLNSSNDEQPADINYEWPRYHKMISDTVDRVERYQKLASKLKDDGLQMLRDEQSLRETLGEGVRAASELAQLAMMPPDPKRVLKGPLGVRKTCAWSDPISFDRFHGIAKIVGCKINDLLLSCVAGCLREELIAAGEDVDNRCVHVTVPVNIRPKDQMDVSRSPSDLGNCFGTVFVPLPVGIENPLERVYKLKHDMIALKQSLQPALSYIILSAAGMLPKQMQKVVLESFGNKTSAVLSNVPGSREKRFIAGSQVLEQMFWVPQTGDIGLGLSIISYGGQVQFGLIGDAQLFPEPQRIVTGFMKQLELHRGDIVAGYIDDLVQPNMAS